MEVASPLLAIIYPLYYYIVIDVAMSRLWIPHDESERVEDKYRSLLVWGTQHDVFLNTLSMTHVNIYSRIHVASLKSW